MSIARRPKIDTVMPKRDTQERERQEQAFLSGAPDLVTATKQEDARMQTVHLRFEPDMLPRIDDAVKEMGLGSRAAWIRYAVMQTLKTQGK